MAGLFFIYLITDDIEHFTYVYYLEFHFCKEMVPVFLLTYLFLIGLCKLLNILHTNLMSVMCCHYLLANFFSLLMATVD